MYVAIVALLSILATSLQFTSVSMVPSGLLAVLKPKDWSSAAVVAKIKWLLQRGPSSFPQKSKVKVGHGGTLDPLASGVLVLGIGSGTKLLDKYLSGSKGYAAQAFLGKETNTLDSQGNFTREVDCSHINEELLLSVLPKFRGDIFQTPPMFSALKRDGQRLYDLARKGEEVYREPRLVQVYSLQLRDFAFPNFSLDIECSGGFYVRSVIDDICRACNGAGHMTDLTRTKQGPFSIEDCIVEDDWVFEKLVDHIKYSTLKAGGTVDSFVNEGGN